MSNEFLVVTKKLVRRGWTDIEPKVAAGFATGSFAVILINILTSYGVHIPAQTQELLPYLFTVLGGYVIPSSGNVITTHDDGVTSTVTTGNTVTTATAPTAIQPPMTQPPLTQVSGKFDNILANIHTANHPGDPDNNATQILH